ncbi:MAG: FUSC family protein [Actinomycetota bacterium]|nr:FUSC family protein [Actinomycetota bacterium]
MSVGQARIGELRRRTGEALLRSGQRLLADAWPLLQSALAATVAWVLAKHVFGHAQPFFAPVAAVIGLNTALGERGLHAVRLLYGVIVGILVGELALLALGDGYVTLGLATLVAMAVAHAIGGARITVAQAAVGAILTIAVGQAEAGLTRLADALIGTGVALIFSQVLFTPEPVGLMRRAEAGVLRGLADALAWTGRALTDDDQGPADRAVERLRDLREQLVAVSRMRRAGARVARRSLVWRGRSELVVRESENAGHLDLLGASCLMLVRTAVAVPAAERGPLLRSVPRLSKALADMADDPGDRECRQRAADDALDVARQLASANPAADTPLAAAVVASRAVAIDVMTFAGVDPAEAIAVAQRDTGVLEVPSPPPIPRSPLGRR